MSIYIEELIKNKCHNLYKQLVGIVKYQQSNRILIILFYIKLV